MNYVVVAFFTKNTPYEEEVKNLIQSLEKYQIPMDIVGISTQGSWKANTHYKPYFLKQMLIKHFPKDILYLDADAVIEQYPELFDHVGFDIGLVYRKRIKLLSGTIYLSNNPKCYKLLVRWIDTCLMNPYIIEQEILEEILENKFNDLSLSISMLPETYCQIYDMMSDSGQAVIKQNQASRRFCDTVGLYKKNIDPMKAWATNQELYKLHLQLLTAKNQALANKIESAHITRLQPCITKKKEPNLCCTVDDITHYYHSQEGALAEAEEFVRRTNLSKTDLIFYYGLGLGYIVSALGKWFAEDQKRHLIIIEDDIEVYYYFLHTHRSTQFFYREKVSLFFYGDIKEELDRFYQDDAKYMTANSIFLTLPYYRNHKKSETETLLKILQLSI